VHLEVVRHQLELHMSEPKATHALPDFNYTAPPCLHRRTLRMLVKSTRPLWVNSSALKSRSPAGSPDEQPTEASTPRPPQATAGEGNRQVPSAEVYLSTVLVSSR
jgi:hypothetical protein